MVFPSRKFGNKQYIDGGIKDNIPIKALKNKGCKTIIVVHLSHGTLWNRNEYPELTIIEIRPSKKMSKIDVPIISSIDALFDFTNEKITHLISLGFQDAKKGLADILRTLGQLRDLRMERNSLEKKLRSIDDQKFPSLPDSDFDFD